MVIIEYTAIQLNHREEKNINLRMYLVIAAHAFCVKKSLQEPFYRKPSLRLSMGRIGKSFSLLLIVLLVVSSLIMAKPTFAQTPTPTPSTIPTPSVPQFTVQLVGPPTIVNTTYSLDPNTGQIVANLGYTNPYSNINLTIKNQQFNPSYGSIYYSVQINGVNVTYPVNKVTLPPEQTSGSDYTKLSFSIEDYLGTQVSIRVQAILGSYFWEGGNPYGDYYIFTGTTSPWSNPQTISVPANVPLSSPSSPVPTSSSSPTSTSTSTPTAKSSLLLITTIALVVIAFLLAIIISLLIYIKKRNT